MRDSNSLKLKKKKLNSCGAVWMQTKYFDKSTTYKFKPTIETEVTLVVNIECSSWANSVSGTEITAALKPYLGFFAIPAESSIKVNCGQKIFYIKTICHHKYEKI